MAWRCYRSHRAAYGFRSSHPGIRVIQMVQVGRCAPTRTRATSSGGRLGVARRTGEGRCDVPGVATAHTRPTARGARGGLFAPFRRAVGGLSHQRTLSSARASSVFRILARIPADAATRRREPPPGTRHSPSAPGQPPLQLPAWACGLPAHARPCAPMRAHADLWPMRLCAPEWPCYTGVARYSGRSYEQLIRIKVR